MKKSPTRTHTLGSILLWVLATFETPDYMCVNLHIILSLNPGIVEYHPAYFSHCSHTFFVILVSRICLMKALVPWSQRFFLKFLFVEERGERETRFFPLSSPLRCSLFPSRRKIWRKTSVTRVRPYILTWFDHSLLSRNFKVNSVIMTVIFKSFQMTEWILITKNRVQRKSFLQLTIQASWS